MSSYPKSMLDLKYFLFSYSFVEAIAQHLNIDPIIFMD